MRQPPKWVANQALNMLTVNKRVLAVEDDLDMAVYTKWLEKLAAPTGTIVSSKVLLVSAGGKSPILRGLEWFRDERGNPSDVFGLVDRDEWDAATVAAKKRELPQLLVNGDRHCLESYFSEPGEIETALQSRDSGRYGPRLPTLRTRLESAVAEWVDHWSLWVTTNRTQGLLRAAEFPSCFHDQHPIPGEPIIRAKFHEWATLIEPLTCLERFSQERTSSLSEPTDLQFRSRVYAKDFFPIVVIQGGLQLIDRFSMRDWMINLAEWAPQVPADLVPILQPLLA